METAAGGEKRPATEDAVLTKTGKKMQGREHIESGNGGDQLLQTELISPVAARHCN